MEKNKVKVVFRDSGDGFHYSVVSFVEFFSHGHEGVRPQTLSKLLYGAHSVGAAVYATELIVEGWGIARWSYTVDWEILRDLLAEGAAAEAAA